MKLYRASGHKRMPWKNGGGETVEIAVFPPGSSVDDFDWRISMATVASDGPFSIFPGIDRTLSILDGNGMSLAIDHREAKLLTPSSPPLAFHADSPAEAILVDGQITDLNVMTRRGLYRHSVAQVKGSFSVSKQSPAETVFVLVTGDVSATTGHQSVNLTALDALLVDAEVAFRSDNIVCYVIRITQQE